MAATIYCSLLLLQFRNIFKSQGSLSFSATTLEDGFPLIIKPVTEYQHRDRSISLNTLATIPIITKTNAMCTVETLLPIHYQQKDKCYTSPLAFNDLILTTCSDRQLIIKADALTKCYTIERTHTFVLMIYFIVNMTAHGLV